MHLPLQIFYFNIDKTRARLWRNHSARTDLIAAIFNFHVWSVFGLHDIKQRYRRSVLGPFWFTLSTFIMVAILGLLYSELLRQSIKDYLPYLGVGLVLWQYISTCVIEGSSGLIVSSYLIKQIKMPITTHLLRICWRNLLILFHSLPIVVLMMILLGKPPGYEIFLIIPGLFIIFLNTIWIIIVTSIVCARYRDVSPIIANVVQVAFFVTPIMWSSDLLLERAWIAHYNPIFHLIEIVRAPILGQIPSQVSWFYTIFMLLIGFYVAQIIVTKYRDKISYWV